jgi:hypothetical protein
VSGRRRVRIRDRRPTNLNLSVFPWVTPGKFWDLKPVKKSEERLLSLPFKSIGDNDPHVALCRARQLPLQQPSRQAHKSVQNVTESLRLMKLLFVAIPRRKRPPSVAKISRQTCCVLGTFPKLRKATIRLVTSVCLYGPLSIRKEQFGSNRTDFHEI